MDSTSATLGKNRSEFIRQAVINELKAMGIAVPASLGFAPDRRSASLRVAESSDDNSEENVQPTVRKSVNYREALKADRKKKKVKP